MKEHPVQLPIRIDWSEMDLFGHVNNVAYFKYIQASRVNYWEQTGLAASFSETRIGSILLSSSCQFLRPLHYPGNIVVTASIEFIKTTSFGIHHKIWNEQNELAAEAHDVIVNFDFGKNEKLPVSQAFREAVSALEGKRF